MKQIYKAEDGKVFELEKDCLEYEFNLNDGNNQFKSMVLEAIEEVESITGLKFEMKKAKAKVDWDGDPNEDKMKYVVWQEVEIKVYDNGAQRGELFSRGSQGGYTKELLVDELIKEYHIPYQKAHEGVIEDSDLGWYREGYVINGVEINEILRAHYGKRIRIEVID